MENISDQLIPLLQVPEMFGLVERVILFATKGKLHYTMNSEYGNTLSKFFVEHLVFFHHDMYMKLCSDAILGYDLNFYLYVTKKFAAINIYLIPNIVYGPIVLLLLNMR
jgi:hypothetical protein